MTHVCSAAVLRTAMHSRRSLRDERTCGWGTGGSTRISLFVEEDWVLLSKERNIIARVTDEVLMLPDATTNKRKKRKKNTMGMSNVYGSCTVHVYIH